MRDVMCHPVFRPLGRLTYCAFLVHPAIIRIYLGNQRQPLYSSDMQLVMPIGFDFRIFNLYYAKLIRTGDLYDVIVSAVVYCSVGTLYLHGVSHISIATQLLRQGHRLVWFDMMWKKMTLNQTIAITSFYGKGHAKCVNNLVGGFNISPFIFCSFCTSKRVKSLRNCHWTHLWIIYTFGRNFFCTRSGLSPLHFKCRYYVFAKYGWIYIINITIFDILQKPWKSLNRKGSL